MILIKTTSKGPIIYKSKRVGLNGCIFDMYKFRTMINDADEKLKELIKNNKDIDQKLFKLKNDPRITKVGKVLRKLSLDELPQFFNIIKGDMSIVGPRACLVSEYEIYDSYEKQIVMVRPGIAGIWQYSGRSNLTFDEKILLDLIYIDSRSFIFDCFVLFKTIISIIFVRGAY